MPPDRRSRRWRPAPPRLDRRTPAAPKRTRCAASRRWARTASGRQDRAPRRAPRPPRGIALGKTQHAFQRDGRRTRASCATSPTRRRTRRERVPRAHRLAAQRCAVSIMNHDTHVESGKVDRRQHVVEESARRRPAALSGQRLHPTRSHGRHGRRPSASPTAHRLVDRLRSPRRSNPSSMRRSAIRVW